MSLNAAANPKPFTTAVHENGGVSVPTSLCAHRSRTVSDVAVMFIFWKHSGPHVMFAAASPVLTKPRAWAPPESCRPHTLVQVCDFPVWRHLDGPWLDATVAMAPVVALYVKFWLLPPLHCHTSTPSH